MRRIIGLLLTLMPATGFAQTNMSIQDCIDYTLKNQVKMRNAYLDQKISDAKNKEITGLALPKLSAKGGINYAPLVAAFLVPNFIKGSIVGDASTGQPGLVNSQYLDQNVVDNTPNNLSLAFQPKWTTTATAEASQLLFDPGIMVALQARKELEALSRRNIELTAQELKVAVVKAYYNILIAEKRSELLDRNVERIQQLENETKEIYKSGFAEKLDVDRISVTLNNLQTEKIKVKQLVDLTYMMLKFQMGMPLEQDINITDTLSDRNFNLSILNDVFDYHKRTEYQLLENQRNLNAFDLKRYKLAGLPTLSLFGNYGYTLYNSDNLFNKGDKFQKSALIGTSLNVPIFDGLQRRNKLKQARYTVEKNENDLENLRNALKLEEQTARITFESNVRALENQRKNMQLAEEVYNKTKIKYKEGVGSSLEVVTAESALKEAQTNYFSALYDVMTSKIDLEKALGNFK